MKKLIKIVSLLMISTLLTVACSSTEATNEKENTTKEIESEKSNETDNNGTKEIVETTTEEVSSKDALVPLEIVGEELSHEYENTKIIVNGIYKITDSKIKETIKNDIDFYGTLTDSEYLILDYDLINNSNDDIAYAPHFLFVNEIGAEWGQYANVAHLVEYIHAGDQEAYEKLGNELNLTVDNNNIQHSESGTMNIRLLYAATKEKKFIDLGGYDTDEPLFVTTGDDFFFEVIKQ